MGERFRSGFTQKFIPPPKEIGLVTQIDRLVAQEAMQIFVKWKKKEIEIGKLS